ncbi:MAG: rhomboid family intramembrane serine protease [Pirellulaceae bacterium]|nr:rhomboid family intramembrane serine protease [Pirellulaceae bacterium]
MGIYDRPYYQEDGSPNMAPSWDQRSAIANIVIACTVVFLANMIFSHDSNAINRFLTLRSEDLQSPWMLWRTLSYGFAHSQDLKHIIFNLLGLWMLGRSVEERYGRAEFLRIYLSSVVICGLGWLALRTLLHERASVCGASGAVCCIEMLYVLNFPRSTIMMMGVLPMQAWVFGIIFILGNLSMGGSGGESRIAWDVHLIGIGLACVYFFGKWNLATIAAPLSNWKLVKRKWMGPKLRTFQPSDSSTTDEIEADRILDKIHEFGQDSLTSKEKRFLTKYSKTVRNKRQNTPP